MAARHTDADLFHQWEEAEERAEKWQERYKKEKQAHEQEVRQYRTNEVAQMWMNFVQDAIAKIEGLLGVNRDFCKRQIAQNSPQMPPPNCAVLP